MSTTIRNCNRVESGLPEFKLLGTAVRLKHYFLSQTTHLPNTVYYPMASADIALSAFFFLLLSHIIWDQRGMSHYRGA